MCTEREASDALERLMADLAIANRGGHDESARASLRIREVAPHVGHYLDVVQGLRHKPMVVK